MPRNVNRPIEGIACGKQQSSILRVTTLQWTEKEKRVKMRTTNPRIIKQIRSYMLNPNCLYKQTAVKEFSSGYTIAEFEFPLKCLRFRKPKKVLTPEQTEKLRERGKKALAARRESIARKAREEAGETNGAE